MMFISSSMFLVYYVVFLITKVQAVEIDSGVLVANSSVATHEFCIFYFPAFKHLPSSKSQITEWRPLVDYSGDLCGVPSKNAPFGGTFELYQLNLEGLDTINGSYVLSNLGNCSIEEQALTVANNGGTGLIISLAAGSPLDNFDVNVTQASEIGIPISIIQNSSAAMLKVMNQEPPFDLEIGLYSPSNLVDASLVLVWVLAIFAVVVGSWWSGHVRHSLRKSRNPGLPESGDVQVTSSPRTLEEESSLNVSPLLVFVFVLIMGSILVLLYFFYQYLVYVILTLFVMASILSVYACLEPLVMKIPLCSYNLSQVGSPFGLKLDVKQILLFCGAVALSLTWLIYRKEESFAWILQDLLGLFFCINMLKSIRLPSYKICTILLVLLFVYDIFFVFITPYFTMKGDSVMVKVATGGSSQEQLPMLFRVPHLWSLTPCLYQKDSILGFGDILVPGLLVSYCHGFDLLVGNSHKTYFVLTATAYGAGMIFTFLGLILMSSPQPALLYLVPSVLIPPALLAWFRGELRPFWAGEQASITSIQEAPEESSPVLANSKRLSS